MLIMKIWLRGPKIKLHYSEGFKTIEEYLNVEDNLLEENEELITNFDLFDMWTSRLTLEHKLMLTTMKVKQKKLFRTF